MTFSTRTAKKTFLVVVFFSLSFFLCYWCSLLFLQSPNAAGIENNTIYFIQRLLAGMPLYSNPEHPPYSITQYTPLYYCMVAGAAKLTGVSAEDVLTLFLVNRIVSLLLLLLVCFIVYYTGRKIYRFSLKKSLVLCAVVFIYMEISSFARPDSLAHAVWFLSLFFFLTALRQEMLKKTAILFFCISAATAAVAFFSKQSALTLPVLCCGWLAITRQRLPFFIYTGVFTGVMLLGLLVIHYTGGLPVFFMNIINGLNNGINLSVYFDYIIQEFLSAHGLLWTVTMIPVLWLLYKQKKEELRFLGLLIASQFAASCLAALKYGASSNYFTEWWILVLLGAACCWDYFTDIITGVDDRLIYIILIFLLLIRVTTPVYHIYSNLSTEYQASRHKKYQTELEVTAFVQKAATGKEEKVFNNIFSPDSYLNNLLFRQAMMPQTDITVLGTYYRNVFDYAGFRQQLANGKFPLLVIKTTEGEKGFLKMNTDAYSELTVIGPYKVMRYKENSP